MQPLPFAGYSLVQRLGRGGVSSVHKALGPSGAVVAIKVLNAAAQDDDEVRRRFQQEFEVARKVAHPHVVRYLQCGTDAGRPYIVMEYVEGLSLWERVRQQGPLPPADAARVAAQIGAALDAGHRRNILHRDVKPNNILITPAGDGKLTDFGLLKDLEAACDLTADHAILGTPFFMAPEQFFDARGVGRPADVYGLAATMAYALTGRVPFKFRGPGLLEKKLAGQFHPPGEPLPNISPEVVRVLAAGLDPEPDRRPPSTEEFARALTAAARARPSAAPPAPAPQAVERRSVLRRKCVFAASGQAATGTTAHPARIIDLSTEGLCLIATCRYAPRSVLRVSFEFNDADDCWDYQVRVVHVAALDGGRWRHGCRFLEPMDRAEFLALVNEKPDNVLVRIAAST